MKSAATQATIDQTKHHLAMCKQRLEATLRAVPDEKLSWLPAPTAKSVMQIAAHCAMSNYFFAGQVRQTPAVDGDRATVMAEAERREQAITTREAFQKEFDASVAEVMEALDSLTDETIAIAEVPSNFFPAPMTFWMNLPARHLDNHAAQIDYIQTLWGDMEWHMM